MIGLVWCRLRLNKAALPHFVIPRVPEFTMEISLSLESSFSGTA